MKKILYNNGYGGFMLSEELLTHFGYVPYSNEAYAFIENPLTRTNEALIREVERVGLEAAGGRLGKLAIREIEDDDVYQISDYDGKETLEYVGKIRGNILT